MQSWTDSRLWKQLKRKRSSSPERPSIQALLQQWMPKIETVLAKAGTSPPDFTLHDAEHSFRVAEWMAKIVPADVLPKLSDYELALLLLSAYLHDIGMTPEQARVQRHWRHLVFGSTPEEKEGLYPEEAAEFQSWLDDERDGLVPPLARDGKAGEDDLRRAAELITYYARHMHNVWSADWIRQHATGDLGSYEGWVEDLVSLCQSHHEGYADLVRGSFDPRPVGRLSEVVHLRYLACVLRVADILDVDPERTPPVLFQHRGIAPKSVIYWWKDHDFKVLLDGSTLVVHARPRSAVVEKAVRDTAEWIRLELETCARLGREKPFSHSPFRASQPLPHRWSFPESLLLQIRPRNDDYVYIDGAFRPNTAKLLELLSGIQLYKEPLAAVRELLQNAFDAVKEQIALERLEGDPADEKRTDAIIALQSVELRFEERDGRFWLLCTDNGVGMTRAIIEKYLLVSGSSRRHDILELERHCEAAGFNLGRTGQFGIGVLSYFMLADRVEIRTRRSAERGDAETHGWHFQTEGVGSFGELRKDAQIKRGTEVGLRLRRAIVTSRDEFLLRLQKYLLDAFLRLPCPFRLVVEEDSCPRLGLEAGWQPVENRLIDGHVRKTLPDPPGWLVLSRSSLKKHNLNLSEWAIVAERFLSAIRWSSKEGQLPDGIGHYRLAVPFFDLPGGRSGLFFDFDGIGLAKPLPLVNAHAVAFQLELRTSFQGMSVRSTTADGELIHDAGLFYLMEVDWEGSKGGQIAVDRNAFSLTTEALAAIAWLRGQGEDFQARVLSQEPSDYDELNAMLNERIYPPLEISWFVNSADQEGLRWEGLSLPALSASSLHSLGKAVRAQKDGRVVSIFQPLTVYVGSEKGRKTFDWRRSRARPICPVVVSASPLVIIPQYISGANSYENIDFFRAEFPAAWSSLAAVGSNAAGEPWLWNQDHPLTRAVDAQDLAWFANFDPVHLSEGLLQSRGRSALYLMRALNSLHPDFYREIAEDFRAGFWHDLWAHLALDAAKIFAWIQQTDGKGLLWVFRAQGLERIPATDPRIHQYLPYPGDEWKLTITYRDDLAGIT